MLSFLCAMFSFLSKQAKPLAVCWLLLISVLFFLPGSALPKEDWLDKIYFDKWVHVGFFAVLLFLWRCLFPVGKKYDGGLMVAALLYGLSVEVIQHYLVANRSFDAGDVLADAVGALAGIWLWKGYKKIDPCRNRGRNQN